MNLSFSGYNTLSCFIISSILHLNFITLAGFPTATAYGGIFFVTTEEAPIMAPRPICAPANSVTLIPIQTSSSTKISLYSLSSLLPLRNFPIC